MADDAAIQLAIDDGSLKLGDTIVPGIYQGLEVRGAVALDEQSVPGRSGSSKQPLGFDDAEVTLRVVLLDDDTSTASEKLIELVGLFKAQDAFAKPFVYRLVCPTLEVWKIDQVVFRELRSAENSDTDQLEQELVFVEHKPVALKAEQRRSQVVATPVAAGYVQGGQVTQLQGDFAAPAETAEESTARQQQQDLLEAGGWMTESDTDRRSAIAEDKAEVARRRYAAGIDDDDPADPAPWLDGGM